jgi:hypothetical protein
MIMDKYIEAPTEFDGEGKAIFCAGGITGCPDWQSQMVELLKASPWIILNPRRASFPIHDPSVFVQYFSDRFHMFLKSLLLFWSHR